ncbi:MAG: hypothetical protein RLZ98_1684 [Pseudomonadota bacterium]|jgi:GMP synthase (glutamine-hydrolysing)
MADSEPVQRKIVIVLHRDPGSPGAVGQWLEEQGYALDIRRPKFGDDLPEDLAAYSGAIVFGGPDSANDDHPFIRAEIRWIEQVLAAGTPYLGICLGGQMLANVLDAPVRKHDDGLVERGYYPLSASPEGKAFCSDWPSHVYQWHQEGFEIPRSTQVLATSSGAFPNQAFLYGASCIGLQFHPEITFRMVDRWSRREEQLEYPGAHDRQTHFAQHLLFSDDVRIWLGGFLKNWLKNDK